MLSYRQNFSHPTIGSLMTEAEKFVAGCDNRKRIFMVIVEMLQNVSRHGIEENPTRETMFQIQLDESRCEITSRNMIRTSETVLLSSTLDRITSLDMLGLKALYTDTITRDSSKTKIGAGLGLILLARKADRQLQWSFATLTSHTSLFSLTVTITTQHPR